MTSRGGEVAAMYCEKEGRSFPDDAFEHVPEVGWVHVVRPHCHTIDAEPVSCPGDQPTVLGAFAHFPDTTAVRFAPLFEHDDGGPTETFEV